MSKLRWNEQKTKAFVLSYLQKPSLWNLNDSSYSKKTDKQQAYTSLIQEFDLNLNEVRNKIRIFRTTYSQERKKLETIDGYVPKLSWFNAMHSAFREGKVKSFSKSLVKEEKSIVKEEEKNVSSSVFQIEYVDEDHHEDETENVKEDQSHIIIEPYEEEDEEEEQQDYSNQVQDQKFSTSKDTETQNDISMTENHSSPVQHHKPKTLLSSNELFLQSLKSSLDSLSDEKNMKARIKIQEALYDIMYQN